MCKLIEKKIAQFYLSFSPKNDNHNEMFWINNTHSYGHIHFLSFFFQIMSSLPINVIEELQDFLKLLIFKCTHVEITNRKVKGKIKVESSLEIKFEQNKIVINFIKTKNITSYYIKKCSFWNLIYLSFDLP